MKTKAQKNMIELDGRTGEGGGQLVRIAVCLSALTGKPLRITNVRGNRGGGKRGGGLKAQHASCIRSLAEATQAEVTGCFVGSKEFSFISNVAPSGLKSRNIKIDADSAASILLIFQAIFPFLLFAGAEDQAPTTVTIRGGTNVSFSLSYDYLDQVVLPSLELFGVPKVERTIQQRGWSHGTRQIGSIKFKFYPLPAGQKLSSTLWPSHSPPNTITRIDITLIVPSPLRAPLKASLAFELDLVFPGVETQVLVDEDSHHSARIYVLLVAHNSLGFRFGRDWLYDKITKNKPPSNLSTEIAQKVVDDLDVQLRRGGCVDERLHDQLVIFQALAAGRSAIPEVAVGEQCAGEGAERVFKRTEEPFGEGSLHARTARWVVARLLPETKWLDGGRICEGVGWSGHRGETSGLEDGIRELTLEQ